MGGKGCGECQCEEDMEPECESECLVDEHDL